MNYRFSPDRGFRRQGESYSQFESDISEIDSEWYETLEDFLLACFSNSSEALEEDSEGTDDTN